MAVITADTPLLGPASASPDQCIRYVLTHDHGEYDRIAVVAIVSAYYRVAESAGLDPLLAIAQTVHETHCLTSALSQRRDRDGNDCRNPAGIGVNGERSDTPKPGFVYDADRNCYRRCIGFASWANDAIPVHIGRLLAYAVPAGAAPDTQRPLIQRALNLRPLPLSYRGSAPTLRGLAGRWAVPGRGYAEAIARVANAIRGM